MLTYQTSHLSTINDDEIVPTEIVVTADHAEAVLLVGDHDCEATLWPDLDALCHHYGLSKREVLRCATL